jgi:O-antigen ligase
VLPTAVNERVAKCILIILPLVTLTISPWKSFDSINLPKFATMIIGTALIAGISLSQRPFVFIQNLNAFRVAVVFLLAMSANLYFNGLTTQQFFGTYGSHFGYITFFSLTLVFILSAGIYSISFYKHLLVSLMAAGLVNLVYGGLQWLELDPVSWSNPYDKVIGTLGNPNYFSALMGMSGIASISLTFVISSVVWRVLLTTLSFGMTFLAFVSNSIQGLFALLAGLVVLIYLIFLKHTRALFQTLYLAAVTAIALFSFAGILNRGPLQDFIYGNSVIARKFYWNSALEMARTEPMRGFGLDSFGDYYRTYRSDEAAIVFGPDTVANSSHNLFLDILVYGGAPLLLSFLAIIFLALRSAFFLSVNKKQVDAIGAGLVACWLASIVQSLVSPSQLGLAVWVWSLSGAIIGYQKLRQEGVEEAKSAKRKILPPQTPVAGVLGLGIGLLLTVPPLAKDVHFRRAVEIQDAKQIINASMRWPIENYYLNYASELFLASSLYDDSLEIAKNSVLIDDNNFNGWRLIFMNPKSTEREKLNAIAQIRRIDPNFKSET